MKKLIKKGDMVIILVICLIAAGLLIAPALFPGKGTVAIVVQNGKMTDEIDLSAVNGSYELIINGGKLLVEKNQISYMESDCPDHICVRTGILKNAGDTAACVPNKTCVYIKGKKNIDAITY